MYIRYTSDNGQGLNLILIKMLSYLFGLVSQYICAFWSYNLTHVWSDYRRVLDW
jgi:hypothetical protein